MLANIKSKLVQTLGPFGVYATCKFITSRNPRILMYHRFTSMPERDKVTAQVFEKQLLKLKNTYNVLPLRDISQALSTGAAIPTNAIAITIDDGYLDFFEVAYPVLKRHQVPATIFLTTDFVDGKIWLWPDKISYILDNSNLADISLDLAGIENKTPADRNILWSRIIDYCVKLDEVLRQDFIQDLAIRMNIDLPESPPLAYTAMSWDNVRELYRNDIDIGAHTRTHPILSTVPERSLKNEISVCKSIIEEKIQSTVHSFCYPNGQKSDYNERIKQLVITSGYSDACVAYHDGSALDDLYELRRHAVGNNMFQFYKAISGTELLGKKIGAFTGRT